MNYRRISILTAAMGIIVLLSLSSFTITNVVSLEYDLEESKTALNRAYTDPRIRVPEDMESWQTYLEKETVIQRSPRQTETSFQLSEDAGGQTHEVYPTDWTQYEGQTYLWYDDTVNDWILTGTGGFKKTTEYSIIDGNGEPAYPWFPDLLPFEFFSAAYQFDTPGNVAGLYTASINWVVERGLTLDNAVDEITKEDVQAYKNFMKMYERRQEIMDEHMLIVHEYFSSDDDNIQQAIDLASPGDTIVLKPGKFYLAKYGSEDATIQTANGEFRFWEDYWGCMINPFYDLDFRGLRWGIWPKLVNIDKPGLTVQGEFSADSENPSIITHMNKVVSGGPDVFLAGDGQYLLINAPNVAIKNLQCQGMLEAIHAYHAGFNIDSNRFVDCGFGWYLNPDAFSTYPYFPNLDAPVKSYFVNNDFINCAQAPHLIGSEVIMTNNHFDVTGQIIGLAVLTWGLLTRGIVSTIPTLPINFDYGFNNVVEGNSIDMHDMGSGIWVGNYFGGEMRNCIIRNNLVENCNEDGIWVYSGSEFSDPAGSSGHIISDNIVRRCLWPMGLYAFAGDSLVDCEVTGNVFVDCSNPDVFGYTDVALFVGTGGPYATCSNNRLILNDYRQSGLLGMSNGYPPCVLLLDYTSDNYVLEVMFPSKSTMHEQVLDFGVNNIIVGFPES